MFLVIVRNMILNELICKSSFINFSIFLFLVHNLEETNFIFFLLIFLSLSDI